MATPPFAAPFEASLKTPPQGGILELLSGHVVYPQFFCCISGTSTGVLKAPVALIKAIDHFLCTGTPVCIDILGSWSPTGTLDLWAVDWDDGNNSNGNWPPAGDVCHPLGGYALPGTYEITLTVTDILGVTDSDIIYVEVIDCACVFPPCMILVGGIGSGPFYTENLGGASVWNGLDVASLVTAGSKSCNVLIEYHWSDGHISIFMGTGCGIYEYIVPAVEDIYGGTWDYITLPADLLNPAGITGTFDVWDIKMSMEREGWGYCTYAVRNWPDFWFCCAHTRDGWQTIHTATIVFHGTAIFTFRFQCSIAQHSGGETVYVAYNYLYRSTNHAVTFTTIDATWVDKSKVVHVPWNSPSWNDSIIYWGGEGRLRRSGNEGVSFSDLPHMGRVQQLHGPVYGANWVWGGDWNPGGRAYNWDPVGGTVQFGPQMGTNNHCWDTMPLTLDPLCAPTTMLLVGDYWTGAWGEIKVNTPIGRTDCIGDWNTKTGNAAAFSILRRTPEPMEFDVP